MKLSSIKKALDISMSDINISEELINQVLIKANEKPQKKTIKIHYKKFIRPLGITASFAIFIIMSVYLLPQIINKNTITSEQQSNLLPNFTIALTKENQPYMTTNIVENKDTILPSTTYSPITYDPTYNENQEKANVSDSLPNQNTEKSELEVDTNLRKNSWKDIKDLFNSISIQKLEIRKQDKNNQTWQVFSSISNESVEFDSLIKTILDKIGTIKLDITEQIDIDIQSEINISIYAENEAFPYIILTDKGIYIENYIYLYQNELISINELIELINNEMSEN